MTKHWQMQNKLCPRLRDILSKFFALEMWANRVSSEILGIASIRDLRLNAFCGDFEVYF